MSAVRRTWRRAQPRRIGADDGGNAIVEFVWLAVLLMVPLTYLVLAVFRVQSAAFGVSTAARAAARAYAAAPDGATRDDRVDRARAAAALAMSDQGFTDLPADAVDVVGPVPEPGRTGTLDVTVTVAVRADLPGVPAWFGHAASVAVHSRHTERLDVFAGGVP